MKHLKCKVLKDYNAPQTSEETHSNPRFMINFCKILFIFRVGFLFVGALLTLSVCACRWALTHSPQEDHRAFGADFTQWPNGEITISGILIRCCQAPKKSVLPLTCIGKETSLTPPISSWIQLHRLHQNYNLLVVVSWKTEQLSYEWTVVSSSLYTSRAHREEMPGGGFIR